MARWKARLAGEDFDLEDLPAWFTSSDLRVIKDDDGYVLESATFEALDTAVDVQRAAGPIVRRINGIARLRRGSWHKVELSAQFIEQGPDGERKSQILAAATVAARGKVNAVLVRADKQTPPPRPPGSGETDRRLALAASNDDVAEILEIIGTKPTDQVNLYKILEIIDDAAGGIMARGWASNNELERFTYWANRKDVSGSDARHARLPGQQSTRVRRLTTDEAEAFIWRIVESWLTSLT